MHISTKFCAFVAAASLAVAGATAATPKAAPVDLTKFVYKAKNSHSAFGSERSMKIEAANKAMLRGDAGAKFKASADDKYQPSRTIGPTGLWGDMDAPNGETWFYTMAFEYEDVVMNEYWTDHILQRWELTVYNDKMEKQYVLKDDIHYNETETRAVYFDILPVLTRNYFNSDDKYEIIMSQGMNTNTPGVNSYKSFVYQLDGEKDENGNDKIVYTVPNLISDVLDATVDGKEQFYLTLMDENFPDIDYEDLFGGDSWTGETDGEPNEAYWEFLLGSHISLSVYSGVDADGKLIRVLKHDIPFQSLPGDQEYAAFMITKMNGNQPIILFNQYKETLFYPYYDYTSDIVQRDENALKVDIYKLYPDKAELDQTTEIPFTLDRTNIAQFFSVGSFSYRGDVDYTTYKPGDKASLIVTRQDKQTMDQESGYPATYTVYNADGTKNFDIAKNTVACVPMSDIAGYAPQYMFATYNGVYYFHFVNILTGEVETSFNYLLEIDGDNDPVTSNIDRVPYGDSYAYVGELRAPLDEDDYTFMRIVWIDRKGEPLFVDEMNMGMSIHYGQSYISQAALAPDLFHTDSKREYMMLVKRGNEDGGSSEELLIAQPRSEEDEWMGTEILRLTADERGALSNIGPYFETGMPQLVITYYNRVNGHDTYSVDIYDLPLDDPDHSGVSAPGAVSNAAITFDGAEVAAAGEFIEIFNLQGILVKAGNERVGTASLPAGAYIAKTTQGALKFVKK